MVHDWLWARSMFGYVLLLFLQRSVRVHIQVGHLMGNGRLRLEGRMSDVGVVGVISVVVVVTVAD